MQGTHHISSFATSLIALGASWLIAVPVILVLLSITLSRHKRYAMIEAVSAGAVTFLLVKVAGALYVHQRPFIALHTMPLVRHVADNSFPSDHAAAAGLAAAYVWCRNPILGTIAVLCAVLIGMARVAAGVHWPIDIVAGYFIGGLAYVSTRTAMRKLTAQKESI